MGGEGVSENFGLRISDFGNPISHLQGVKDYGK